MTKHIHGGDVYKHKDCLDFSANLNPLGTPESVKQAIIHSLDHIAQYPQVGCGVLRERIAESEGVKAEEVICGNGAAEVIFTLCHAVKPKRALIPAPTFAEYGQALASTGCELEYYMLTENDGFVLSEAYLDILHKGLDMAFLCNPNNPTGMLIPHRLLKRILEKCRKLDILLVVDECFLDFVKEPEEYSLKHSLSGFNNLFILKAFTKRYAMAGVRLGYGLCSDRKLMERMELCVQPWNVSTMAQAAGLQALTETEYVEEGRQLVFREAQWLKDELVHKGLDMAFLCNPNNPTGMLIPHRLLKRILEKCRKLDILLVVDECFLDFVKEPEEYSLKHSLSGFNNLFILKAFTKRYAMAGVRLGYGLCSDRKLMERMELCVQPWNVSTMAQAAGLQALTETEYVEEGRQLVFREAQWLKDELVRIGYKVFPSEANYIFFKGPEELFDFCLRKRILIRDCSNYPGLTKGYYRIAVKRHEENVKLIEVLEGGILWQKQ